MEARERQVLYFVPRGRTIAPFKVWRDGISDVRAKLAVTARIARLRSGNLGDSRPIGEGASETRVDFGPGYRIYYGLDGSDIILLVGGDKSTQRADIERAKAFWREDKERKREEKRRF
jgi:putative addiction module killer protein